MFKDQNTDKAFKIRSKLNSNVAKIYFNMENYTESLWYAEKALETDSSNTDAKYRICDSLKNLNMHEEDVTGIFKWILKFYWKS